MHKTAKRGSIKRVYIYSHTIFLIILGINYDIIVFRHKQIFCSEEYFDKNAEITNGKMASTKLILSWRIVSYEQVGCVMCVMYSHSHPTEYYRS